MKSFSWSLSSKCFEKWKYVCLHWAILSNHFYIKQTTPISFPLHFDCESDLVLILFKLLAYFVIGDPGSNLAWGPGVRFWIRAFSEVGWRTNHNPFLLDATRNEVVSFSIYKNRDLTKVVFHYLCPHVQCLLYLQHTIL